MQDRFFAYLLTRAPNTSCARACDLACKFLLRFSSVATVGTALALRLDLPNSGAIAPLNLAVLIIVYRESNPA
ncbi:hypothetical protein AJ88_25055 [Mesorhizobium amorphae CCBAU 01583]|nr:hypothetical protein AJ88_25055 [Mesorhizobium amorphae CCBAU 01583]